MMEGSPRRQKAGQSSRRGNWAAYGAALWSAIFAIFHAIWALGWYVGLNADSALVSFAETPFYVYDLVVAGVCAVALPVALALVAPWDRRLPRWLVGFLAWTGTGLLVVRSAASVVQLVYLLATRRLVLDHRLGWELWFYIGAVLFAVATRRYWRGTR